jgi:hypothetical protein
MVSPAVGKVILVPFPFSDLSQSKLRPAVVLANAGRGDLFEFEEGEKRLGVASERHYKLVPREEVTESDLNAHRMRTSE